MTAVVSELIFDTIIESEIAPSVQSKSVNNYVLTATGIAKATLGDDGIICKFFDIRLSVSSDAQD